jgi:hypothetical protein
VEHGIELDREVCTVHEFAQLDHFAKRHFVTDIKLGRFNELIVRFIRQVEDFAVDINAVDKPAEIQKIQDFEWSLDFAKVKDDTGS